MSVNQMLAESRRVLCEPAAASSASIWAVIWLVCSPTVLPGFWATGDEHDAVGDDGLAHARARRDADDLRVGHDGKAPGWERARV
jgi:hypothetical protein